MKLRQLLSLATALVVTFTLSAQTTIVEFDGSNNEFVPGDWTITNDPGFSTSSSIVIQSGESGTLSISNTTAYTNISVEIHFSQAGTTPITFNSSVTDGSSTETNGSLIYTDANTPKVATYSFNNSTALGLNSFTVSDLSMNGTIVYFKMTGTPQQASSIAEDVKKKFTMSNLAQGYRINTSFNGSVDFYSMTGQVVKTINFNAGTSTIQPNLVGGVYIAAIKNTDGKIEKSIKIIAQ